VIFLECVKFSACFWKRKGVVDRPVELGVIVGVLALPWLAIAIDLFFASKPGQANQFVSWLQSHGSQLPSADVGVVLFSMAYLLGAAVSRVAGDFFNDGDLNMAITQDHIGWPCIVLRRNARFLLPASLISDRTWGLNLTWGHARKATTKQPHSISSIRRFPFCGVPH